MRVLPFADKMWDAKYICLDNSADMGEWFDPDINKVDIQSVHVTRK